MPLTNWSPQPLSPEESKLAELILYVAERCADDPDFGATKLNKILHASDFLSFAMTGKAITGAEYFHLDNGPAPRRLVPVRDHLIGAGRLVIKEQGRFSLVQRRAVSLDDADLSQFTVDEISIVNQVIQLLDGKNATDVSRNSHVNSFSLGWLLTGDRETIPYETVFVSAARPSSEDYARARELAETHGWFAAAACTLTMTTARGPFTACCVTHATPS